MTEQERQLLYQLAEENQRMRKQLDMFMFSDRYVFQRNIALMDGINIKLDTRNGTKIGTSALQKIGFYNTAPVAQQTGVAVTAAGIHAALVSLGLITA